MPDEPLFDQRVQQSTLPPELQGKTPEQIAAYYEKKQKDLTDDFNNRLSAATTVIPKEPEGGDFWKDPKKAVKDQVAASSISREEFNRASASVQANMAEMAEFLVAQKFTDWKVFKPLIDDIMSKCDLWSKSDKIMWESAYYYAKGKNPQLITPATPTPTPINPTERVVSAPPNPGAPTPVLDTDQAWVADHLGITHDQYTEAKGKMNEIGSLPFTYDNRNITKEVRR